MKLLEIQRSVCEFVQREVGDPVEVSAEGSVVSLEQDKVRVWGRGLGMVGAVGRLAWDAVEDSVREVNHGR